MVMTLILGGLVVWRVSHMIVKETGPLGIFSRFRAKRAAKQKRAGGMYDLVSCTSCVSVWIGSVAALQPAHGLLSWIAYTLAFSAISMLLEATYTRITKS